MNRRAFLGGLLAAGGAGAVLTAASRPAEAANLLDELKTFDAKALAPEADLPAETAQDAQYYYYGRPRHYRPRPYYRPRRYYAPPRRRVCRRYIDAWGRWVRRCFWA